MYRRIQGLAGSQNAGDRRHTGEPRPGARRGGAGRGGQLFGSSTPRLLQELDTWLNARGVSIVFAEMKDPVWTKIERYGLTRTIDPAHFFPALDAAVAEFVREAPASWRRPEARS